MQKLVIGKNTALAKEEALFIVEFFAKTILGTFPLKKIFIQVRFKELKDGSWGYCTPIDYLKKLNTEFEIVINSKLSKKKQIKTLAHEMWHVKQYLAGIFKYDYVKKHYKWKGKIMYLEGDLQYADTLPWEKEAIAQENVLYAKYREHVTKNRLTFK